MKNEVKIPKFFAAEVVLDNMHPSRILHHITENVEGSKDYLCIVMGRYGKTGKTWLTKGLEQYGYNAIELTEDLYDYIIYRQPQTNSYYINSEKKVIIVVLNERIANDFEYRFQKEEIE